VTEEWWVMMGMDVDRPLDGPFERIEDAMEFARQHYQLGDARLVRLSTDGKKVIVASTDPMEEW